MIKTFVEKLIALTEVGFFALNYRNSLFKLQSVSLVVTIRMILLNFMLHHDILQLQSPYFVNFRIA